MGGAVDELFKFGAGGLDDGKVAVPERFVGQQRPGLHIAGAGLFGEQGEGVVECACLQQNACSIEPPL